MNEQKLTAALTRVADGVELPERFRKPSGLVQAKIRPQDGGRTRRTVISGVVAVAAAVAVLVMIPRFMDTHQDQRSATSIVVADSVEGMAARASVIVRGTVGKPLGTWNLNRDPNDIEKEAVEIRPGTDYEISVREYLKGKGPTSLVLTVPGGTYRGIDEPSRYRFELGKEYIFFLTPIEIAGRTGFILAVAPGYFEIQGNTAIAGAVEGPHSIPNMGIEELLDRIARTMSP